MDSVPYPQQKENFDTLKEDQKITQRRIMELVGTTEASVSAWCQGKKQISRKNAERIVDEYPSYSIEFLRGETPYRNKNEEACDIITNVANAGTKLRAAVSTLASLSGFVISDTPIERTGNDLIDTVHEYTRGCDITRNGRLLCLSMEEMDSFENYICDVVELTLDRLMQVKGIDGREN